MLKKWRIQKYPNRIEESKQILDKYRALLAQVHELSKEVSAVGEALHNAKTVEEVNLFDNLNLKHMNTAVPQTYSVDNLKQLITYVGAQIRASYEIDQNKDGKKSTAELLQFGFQVALASAPMLPVFQNAAPEIRDIVAEEWTELTDHVIATDFLPDDRDRAERWIKSTVFMLNMARAYGAYTIKVFEGDDSAVFAPLASLFGGNAF